MAAPTATGPAATQTEARTAGARAACKICEAQGGSGTETRRKRGALQQSRRATLWWRLCCSCHSPPYRKQPCVRCVYQPGSCHLCGCCCAARFCCSDSGCFETSSCLKARQAGIWQGKLASGTPSRAPVDTVASTWLHTAIATALQLAAIAAALQPAAPAVAVSLPITRPNITAAAFSNGWWWT